MSEADPLLEALSVLWKGASIGEFTDGPSLWRYSRHDHFERLWGALRTEAAPWQQDPRVVVVWDDLPGTVVSEVDVGQSMLTPLSWAACATQAGRPSVTVWILDMTPAEHQDLPLYRDACNLVRGSSSRIRLITLLDWVESWDALQQGPQAPVETVDVANELLVSRLRQEFRVSADFDHHHVSNVLGPLRLLEALGGTPRGGAGREALLALLRSTEGLMDDPHAVSTKRGNGIRALEVSKRFDEVAPVEIVLVDDQHRSGWGEFVCSAVGSRFEDSLGSGPLCIDDGTTPGVRVFASDDPGFLVERIEDAFRENGARGSDCRFELAIREEQEGEPILMLDLRLFSARPAKEEQGFLTRLLKLAEALAASGRALGWRGFEADELEGIRGWLGRLDELGPRKWRGQGEYLDAITLLPRLLSLADISLPIFLFSSTGQRRVMDRLAPYGNVITEFEKPRFFGYGDREVAGTALSGFSKALRRACDLMRARKRCRELIQVPNPYERAWRPRIEEDRAYHLEIYIDETRPQERVEGWRVGGCFALYDGPDEESAAGNADLFEDHLVEKGVRFFEWPGNGPQPPAVIQQKVSPCAKEFSDALKSAPESGCRPVCVGLASVEQELSGKGDLASVRADDQLFLTTLRALVELFLCETTRAIGISDAQILTYSLFANTRIKFLGKDAKREDHKRRRARMDRYRWGIKWHSYRGEIKQETFREDDFAPRVREVIERRGLAKALRALAVELPCKDPNDGRTEPRSFVCRRCKAEVSTERPDIARFLLGKVKEGDLLEGTVEDSVKGGFFVELATGLSGFLRNREAIPRPLAREGVVLTGKPIASPPDGYLLALEDAEGSIGWLPATEVRSRLPRDAVVWVRLTDEFHRDNRGADLSVLRQVDRRTRSASPPVRVGERCLVVVREVDVARGNVRVAAVSGRPDVGRRDLSKGVTISCDLCGKPDAVRPDARALHYVADQVLRDMRGKKKRRAFQEVFGQLVTGEFEERMDEDFDRVLDTSRALDGADPNLAFAAARAPLRAESIRPKLHTPENMRKPRIRDYVCWRVGEALRKQGDGRTFLEVVRRLEGES